MAFDTASTIESAVDMKLAMQETRRMDATT
jgi:hypothetical protein